jgi:hypothetical protein
MEDRFPTEAEIELGMRRANAARVARHIGEHQHAAEIEEGLWDEGVAMKRLGPFFEGVTLL